MCLRCWVASISCLGKLTVKLAGFEIGKGGGPEGCLPFCLAGGMLVCPRRIFKDAPLVKRLIQPLLGLCLLAALPSGAQAQALVPDDHPGFVLAEAIAAHGCVLHQDDVNPLLEAADLGQQEFPMMAVPLMQDGYLRPSGEGTLTLVNWGLCLDVPVSTDAATE